MTAENQKSLESLSLFCHFSGLISVVLGILVIMIDLLQKEFSQIQIGLYIVASGYAFVKISAKLALVIRAEKISKY